MKSTSATITREAFAFIIKKKRKALGYSQEVMAEKVGVTLLFVSMLERNERQPTLTSICGFANAFEMNFSDLMKEVEEHIKAPDQE